MPTTARFGLNMPKNADNRSANLLNDYQTPAYAASIAIATKPSAASTLVNVSPLTGALTLTADVSSAYVGDKLTILLSADNNAGGRVVTFSTGFAATAATLTVGQSLPASISFVFNGTKWLETSRSVTV